ncbi:hypothetical protein [Cupriavidus sp. IDO]|uniref:hypothetical protein n=1 Tax=Cupriavidus sp. IDO TaxID=1539142 RepID=UPI0005799DBD|nr:hypothetical protein [Cupriavidus sp. IDO]KWR87992.1 hypothetical protein RM96_22040 [Cupriavidus sp. IDO]
MAALSDSGPASASRLQPRLRALIAQVRETSRHAIRLSRAGARRGEGDFADCLARLYDHWISFSHGQQRLIWIASAAEVGALSLWHLQHGEQDISATDDPALRALYWTTARRWQGARQDIMSAGAISPRPAAACQPDPDSMCGACRDLHRDALRRQPHAELEARPAGSTPDQWSGGRWFRCMQCTTQWVRRHPVHEPFAVWTVTSPRTGPD